MPAKQPFKFEDLGKMAYIGNSQAIAQVSLPTSLKLGTPPKLNDHLWWRALHGADSKSSPGPATGAGEAGRAEGGWNKQRNLTGGAAFAFWRGVYFSKLLSGSNRLAV